MGGQERVALDLAVGQLRAGHAVLAISIAAEAEGPLAADFRAHGVAVHTVAKREGFDWSLPFRLAARLRRERVEIVHTHNPQPLVYGAPAARLAGARAIHTKHGANPSSGRRLLLRQAAARLVTAFVAVSETTAEVARARHEIRPERLHVIPNGIDLSRFSPDAQARALVRAELGIPDTGDTWLLGTVGRLMPEKDQALLLRAAAPLLGEGTHLLLAGDGPESAALASLSRALGKERFIHFLGARRDIPRVLAACDLFCLSSQTEGLPLVIPEAMATALPVVSTAVGGIPTVLEEGVTGFLVPAGDEAALAARLAQLARDRSLARTVGEKARQVALSRYSAERMVQDYLTLYAMILGRGGTIDHPAAKILK